MRFAKEDSVYEEKLQKVEDLLNELGMVISSSGVMGIQFENDRVYELKDIEDGAAASLPRALDSEKLVRER